jgi:hypothetical protein
MIPGVSEAVSAGDFRKQMTRCIQAIRWRIADWLSRVACWLRGHSWYVADAWHGVPGNRVSELSQRIRDELILRIDLNDEDENQAFQRATAELEELAQMAGENWGHIWPKNK